MNKKRRKVIEEIIGKLDEIYDKIESLETEEQECFDNMPEGLKSSEKGETMESVIYLLGEARDHVGNAKDNLEEIINL